jgi:hypothetical protein
MDLWTDGGPPRGRALLWKHGNYLDAEDAALRAWLHKGEDELRSEQTPALNEDTGLCRSRAGLWS